MKRFLLGQAREQVTWYRQSIDALDKFQKENFMKHISRFLMIAIVVVTSGCFDSSPPAGVTGELVGCITSDDDLYCTTKYADSGVSDATEVLIGIIDFTDPGGRVFNAFHLTTSYEKDGSDRETHYVVYVESLHRVEIFGYHEPDTREGWHIRLSPGDTVAVAIVNPPTVQSPHKGYIIANLTRPETSFEIPEEVGDIDVLDLMP